MITRDTLFMLRPGFEDNGRICFCPFAAQVTGFLTYYPPVRDTLDIVLLGWPKPRAPLVELLGEEHQATPILILGPDAAPAPDRVTIAEANGYRFVAKTIEVIRYLAATRGVPGPH
jgi:hypothetical protein